MVTKVIEKGLYWSIHQHSSAAMHEVDSESASLILTSPPYFPDELFDELKKGHFTFARQRALSDQIVAFIDHLRPNVEEIARILRPGGHAIVQIRDVRLGDTLVPVESRFRDLMEEAGLRLVGRHFWRPLFQRIATKGKMAALKKTHPTPILPEVFMVFQRCPNNLQLDWDTSVNEPIGEPTEDDLALLTSDMMVTQKGRVKVAHPYQSPKPVLAAFVRTYTQSGDLVVDPFAGGGTTGVVAISLGRPAVLYEVDEAVAQASVENLEHVS